jgi:tripartite-type tricarboxylate transporter receptor subunit TctC
MAMALQRRGFLRVASGAAASLLGPVALCGRRNGFAFAQAGFPSRTVRFIVPTPPGTMLDLIPRMVGAQLSQRWGQSVIVENHPGAEQIVGAELVARAEPDGHTLLVTPPGPIVLDQWLNTKLAFDPTALAPVTVLVMVPNVLVVSAGVPAKTFQEWVAYAKTNPGKLNYGSPGGTAQLAQADLMRRLGLELVHIPYQGMGPAINDLVAGHIQSMFAAVGTILPYIKAGKVRAIAITGGARLEQLPGVPVISEFLPGYDHTEWFAVVAPPRTPAPIVDTIWQGISTSLHSSDIETRLKENSLVPVGGKPNEAAAFLDSERARWRAVVAAQH